jgi:hypothetical protein
VGRGRGKAQEGWWGGNVAAVEELELEVMDFDREGTVKILLTSNERSSSIVIIQGPTHDR